MVSIPDFLEVATAEAGTQETLGPFRWMNHESELPAISPVHGKEKGQPEGWPFRIA